MSSWSSPSLRSRFSPTSPTQLKWEVITILIESTLEKEAREMSQAFLERLRDYMDERMKDEYVLLKPKEKPFEIRLSGPSYPWMKWEVYTPSIDIFVNDIIEYPDGNVEISTHVLSVPGEVVDDYLLKYRYGRRLREAKSKEEKEKVFETAGHSEPKPLTPRNV